MSRSVAHTSSSRRLTRRQLLTSAAGAAGIAAIGGGVFTAAERARGRKRLPKLPSSPAPVSGVVRTFVTRPDLRPPVVAVSGGGIEPGYLFVGPSTKGVTQPGPLLVDEQGETVWFKPTRPFWTTNFRVAEYEGKPVLAWWQGAMSVQGFGKGEGVILDSSYREVARVRAANGHWIDAHEFVLTPEGTALFVCYPATVPVDLSPIGGPSNGTALESIIQEVDVRSGRLLFQWNSLEHIPVDESYQRPSLPMDYLHANSIAIAPDGNLLVSARCTWALYKINRRTGQVIWRLGGKRSDFQLGPGAQFSWQHDAQHPTNSTISLFDDGQAEWDDDSGLVTTEPQSRGIVLEVDERRRTARLVQTYRHPRPLLANAMGNLQTLPDGHVLVGWGSNPYVSEFAADGTLLADFHLGNHHETYRAFRYPWTAEPAYLPTIATTGDTTTGASTLHTSWNGATEVSHWLVHAGPRPSHLRAVGLAKSHGFETVIPLPSRDRYVAATALDATGRALATSDALRV
jgi:hypothetical protein